MTEQEKPVVEQFFPDPNKGIVWPKGRYARDAFVLDVSMQVLEERLGIRYEDPHGEWGDQPGPMKHAFLNINGTPVRLVHYEHHDLEDKTAIEMDEEADLDASETLIVDALGLRSDQVEWRRPVLSEE